MHIEPFPERYQKALGDDILRATLLEFQRNWRLQRDRAIERMDFEDARSRLAAVKDDVIRNLPDYLDRFTAVVEGMGGHVHRAATAEEAREIVVRLAAERKVRSVVKSKSMLSEEIGLNEALQAAGIRAVETDLGEWIVQLAGERPSHIIGPALHMNRRQVAELFSRTTGRDVSREDIGEQVGVAREALRSEFLQGQMGISGANAIVADSGVIMLVTNEGNAELVTSVPPLHVVLVGIEKLLPTIADAMLELSLLAPTATGQPATSYVTFVAPPLAEEGEMHVVLVDNGRTAMRESDLFADALRCIRCGACSSVCPSYGAVGGHVFGYVYSGAIGLVNTPFHHGLEHDIGPQSLCVSCNACQTVCPVDIPLPRQILDTRTQTVETYGMPLPQRAALELWSRPRLFGAAARMGAVLQRPVQADGFLEPPGLSGLTAWRKPPALAARPFRDLWRRGTRTAPVRELGLPLQDVTVAYFVQCLTDRLYPEMGTAIIAVLEALGARVLFPTGQHCCGLPALDSGSPHLARRMARQTIETLESCRANYVVSGGTSCVVALQHDYPHLFRDDPEWKARAALQASRTYDFTTFLLNIARLPNDCLSGGPDSAAYHYFCQSYNVLKFREEPSRVLHDICGLELIPLPEANVCCGFGGSVSTTRPEMCSHILERKLRNVDAAGVSLLITDNPGCIMHLRGGIAASGRKVAVKHTAEVVAERVRALMS